MRVQYGDHDVVLENPVVIDPLRHMNNQRFSAEPTVVNDDGASALLDDIIRDNPEKQTELAMMINRINQIRRAARPKTRSPEAESGCVGQSVGAYQRGATRVKPCDWLDYKYFQVPVFNLSAPYDMDGSTALTIYREEKARALQERRISHAQLMAEAKEAFAKMLADAQLARKGGRPKSNPARPARRRGRSPSAGQGRCCRCWSSSACCQEGSSGDQARSGKGREAQGRQEGGPGRNARAKKRAQPVRAKAASRGQRRRGQARDATRASANGARQVGEEAVAPHCIARSLASAGRVRVHRVVIGLIAGLIVGSVIGATQSAVALRVVSCIEPIGQLWVNAIRMTIVPLVVSLLFVSVARARRKPATGPRSAS